VSNFIILYDCINHNKDLSKQIFLSFIWKFTLCEMICWRDLLCRLSLIYLLMEWHGTQLKPQKPTFFFLYHNWKAHFLVYFYCDEHSIFQNFFILFYFLVIINEYMGRGNQSKSLCPIKPLIVGFSEINLAVNSTSHGPLFYKSCGIGLYPTLCHEVETRDFVLKSIGFISKFWEKLIA
jgi:hypothetical protein